jgi:hypothetical protein
MNCKQCGNILSPTDTACPKCNTPVGQVNEPILEPIPEEPVLIQDTFKPSPVEETKIQTPVIEQMKTVEKPAPKPQVEETTVEELTVPEAANSKSKVELKPSNKTNQQFNIFKAAFMILLVVISIGGGVTFGLHSRAVNKEAKETAIKTGYNFRIGNITYRIPSNLIYTQIENGIEVSDYDETWTSDIGPINVAYGDIRTYAKAIKDTYTKYKYKVSDIQTKTLNEREFMTMECSRDNQSILIAFASASSTTTHLITIKTKNNNIDYKVLEDLAVILNNTKVNDNGVEIKTEEATLDFETINRSIVNTTVTQKRLAEFKARKAKQKTKER